MIILGIALTVKLVILFVVMAIIGALFATAIKAAIKHGLYIVGSALLLIVTAIADVLAALGWILSLPCRIIAAIYKYRARVQQVTQ